MPLGLFSGITTNPLLAQRAGLTYGAIDWRDMFAAARDVGAAQLHVQVQGDPSGFARFAERIYAIGSETGVEAVIKIPMVEAALRVVPQIKSLQGKILLTACYSAKQAIIADVLEADFIAPYLGRMREQGTDDIAQLQIMNTVTQAGPCRVMAASLRSATHLVEVAQVGTPVATISPAVVRDMLADEQTQAAWAQFEAVL